MLIDASLIQLSHAPLTRDGVGGDPEAAYGVYCKTVVH